MSKINALVAGATGYIGIQLVKLLTKHKSVKIKYLCGDTSIGKKISSYDKYFSRPVLQMIVNQPLDVVKAENSYEIMASVKGGGLSGQAGAIRHGISKALSLYDQSNRPPLKKVGFLTRDPRVVERKKAGLAKARRSYQFSKR